MKRSYLQNLLLAAVLLTAYYITARFGLKVNAVSGFATLVWIPSGLALAFLFIFGIRFWPAVMLGALLANYSSGAPILAALGIAVGNTLEPVVGVYILKRFVKMEPQLNRINHVLGLIVFAAFLSTLISATVGVTSLWLAGVVHSSDYGITWISWWSGDAISDLVIAPVLLVWSIRQTTPITRKYLAELGTLLFVIILVTLVIFGGFNLNIDLNRPRTYLIFPPLIWAALRFGQRASVSFLFLFSVAAIWYTARGLGPFNGASASDNLLDLQIYMAVVASTVMILAAAVSEQKVHERKKDEFISVASHELRTPLTSIKIFAQTLQLLFEKKGDKETLAYLKQVNKQIDRLNSLVIKLLDITRIQEGKITLQKERFNIGKLVREIVGEISETTKHNFLIKGNLNTSILADRDRIGRVLTNLLSNAVNYSPKSTKIIIKLNKGTKYLTISVQDFGVGIAKADQEHIFDRFYQVGSGTTRQDSNLGLGLYIANEIVDLHGGSMWLESAKSSAKGRSGTTFYFKLPLKPE